MKRMISRPARHPHRHPQDRRPQRGPRERKPRKLNPPIAQPVVRVHPETGKKALYIGEKVSCFVDMTEEESRPLIDYLLQHATGRNSSIVTNGARTTSSCGTIAAPCTSRSAIMTKGERRHLERTTVKGSPSGYYAAMKLKQRREPRPHEAPRRSHGLRACWRSCRDGKAPVSRQADPHGHPVRAGRHDRPAGARGRPAYAGGLGPAGRRRQSRRRQRRRGGRDRRQVAARRLHAALGGDGPCHQSADLQEAALRRRTRTSRRSA